MVPIIVDYPHYTLEDLIFLSIKALLLNSGIMKATIYGSLDRELSNFSDIPIRKSEVALFV